MTSSASALDGPLLLWFLGVLVYGLGAYVVLGSLRETQREVEPRSSWALRVTAGTALGTVLCAGFVLALSGTELRFAMGFQPVAALGLWLLAMVGGVLVAWGVSVRANVFGFLAGALVLAALAVGLQSGWLVAVGFRPGLDWRLEYLAAAMVAMAVGLALALTMGFSEGATRSHQRLRWRLGAATVLALSFVVGQELMVAGAALKTQMGSAYAKQLPAPLLSLAAGALVPMVLAVVALDLRYGRRRGRGHNKALGTGAATERKKRRRYRILGL